MTTDSDDIDILIAKLLNEYLMDKSGRGGLYYFLVVNGGKRIIVLEDGYYHSYSGYLEREGTR